MSIALMADRFPSASGDGCNGVSVGNECVPGSAAGVDDCLVAVPDALVEDTSAPEAAGVEFIEQNGGGLGVMFTERLEIGDLICRRQEEDHPPCRLRSKLATASSSYFLTPLCLPSLKGRRSPTIRARGNGLSGRKLPPALILCLKAPCEHTQMVLISDSPWQHVR